jgi:hypothetical protein
MSLGIDLCTQMHDAVCPRRATAARCAPTPNAMPAWRVSVTYSRLRGA